MSARNSVALRAGPAHLRISGDGIRWLMSMPWYGALREGGLEESQRQIHVHVSSRWCSAGRTAKIEGRHEIALHMEQAGVLENGVVVNTTVGNHYHVEPSELRICVADNEAARLDSFQLLRGVLLLELIRLGGLPLHAAICSGSNGQGIALVGPSGAGKTSFAMGIVAADECLHFMTGDKAVLMPDGIVLALPFAAAIAPATVDAYPLLNVRGRVARGKYLIWPHDVANALGGANSTAARIRALALCRLDLRSEGVSVEPATAREKVAAVEAASNYSHATTPQWLMPYWDVALPTEVATRARLESVPTFSVSGNPTRSTHGLARKLGLATSSE